MENKIKKKKLKLKANQRDNRRYLLVSENNNETIEKAILDYVGILGMAKSAYMPVKNEKGKLIVSVRREELEKVRAALALASIKVEKVSGTIKGLN